MGQPQARTPVVVAHAHTHEINGCGKNKQKKNVRREVGAKKEREVVSGQEGNKTVKGKKLDRRGQSSCW